MEKMSVEECKQFLREEPRTAKLATVRPDGRPHVVPVWFDLDEDTVIFTTWHETVKAENIRHNSAVCICVDDEAPPFAYVQVEGTAVFSEDAEALRYWATRIGGRYMGEELAETYGKRNSVEGELVVQVAITKMMGYKNIAD